MKIEDVDGELMARFSGGFTAGGLRGGIAAVATLIQAAERERITEDLRRMPGGHVAHECALIHRVIERIQAAAKEPTP